MTKSIYFCVIIQFQIHYSTKITKTGELPLAEIRKMYYLLRLSIHIPAWHAADLFPVLKSEFIMLSRTQYYYINGSRVTLFSNRWRVTGWVG